jgi:hypothetical protein
MNENRLIEDYEYILISESKCINNLSIDNELVSLKKYKDEYEYIKKYREEYDIKVISIKNTIDKLYNDNNNIKKTIIKIYNDINDEKINGINDKIINNMIKIIDNINNLTKYIDDDNYFLFDIYYKNVYNIITSYRIIKLRLNYICRIYNKLIIMNLDLFEKEKEKKNLYESSYNKYFIFKNYIHIEKRIKRTLNTNITPDIFDNKRYKKDTKKLKS